MVTSGVGCVQIAVAALRDELSRALRLIGAQTDITEKKAVDNLLRQADALFQAVFENSPIAKAIVSLDGCCSG